MGHVFGGISSWGVFPCSFWDLSCCWDRCRAENRPHDQYEQRAAICCCFSHPERKASNRPHREFPQTLTVTSYTTLSASVGNDESNRCPPRARKHQGFTKACVSYEHSCKILYISRSTVSCNRKKKNESTK